MATIDITKESFEETVANNEIVLIDFWASWCGPCKMFAPIFERVSEEYPDIVFAKVNTEEEQELAGAFGIRSIPTLMVFRDQIGLLAQPGALPQEALTSIIKQVQSLDMDDVRKQIAEHEAKEEHVHGPDCDHD